MNLENDLKAIFSGDIKTDSETLDNYSHDASLFELRPQLVAIPKSVDDIKSIVKFVTDNKGSNPDLSVTVRSAGTDMSGGAINTSIIIDPKVHLNKIHSVTPELAHLQPGAYYRDLDEKTKKLDVMMPTYPASRDLATVGGMTANDAGGEKSLEYGKTADFVTELKVVFADGNEYIVKPLTKPELVRKMSQGDFEGDIYKRVFDLIEANYNAIQLAQPKVTKNCAGYQLWNVWNRQTGIFDLTRLIVGSQGTLGIITDIKFRLVPRPKHAGTLVIFMKDIKPLGEVINKVLEHKPATFESFDDNTLWLAFRFFFSFINKLGLRLWLITAMQLIPNAFALLRGVPKLILMVEFTGDSVEEVEQKIIALHKDLKPFKFPYMEINETEDKSRKFWLMRRESFNLLRSKVKDKHTAPFIDDLIIPTQELPEAWPRLREIVKKYKLMATIAGHMGDGNFHIIPLMDISKPEERAKFTPAIEEVNNLVIEMGGSLSSEHNDGMVRGPWLEKMYGKEIFGHMKTVKDIFDPQNIFNPKKKTDADWDYSLKNIRQNY